MSEFVIGITLGFILGTITGIIFGKGFIEWLKK